KKADPETSSCPLSDRALCLGFGRVHRHFHNITFDSLIQGVNLGLDDNGTPEGDNDAAISANVVQFEPSFLTVFQPLLADLVAADMIAPNGIGHGGEVLCGVDVHARFAWLIV